MADLNGGLVGSPAGIRDWAEPEPYGCEFFIRTTPASRDRNRRILDETARRVSALNTDTEEPR